MFIYHVSSTDHERVVIFFTDHSHEDTGDLYVGPKFCARIDDVSGLRYHLARALTLL